jgi:predicted RNA-binding Zn-ribbon protein involved in translation (DUF1610 family)
MIMVLIPIVCLFITYLDPNEISTLVAGVAVVVALVTGNLLLISLACPRCGTRLSGRGRWSEGSINASRCPECSIPFHPTESSGDAT